MSKPSGTFSAWINPLQFLSVDQSPDCDSIMEFLCKPGLDKTPLSLVTRYREIADREIPLIAAPAEERILEKLVWPLRHAKASYMLGNYIGTIALAGMVAEMVAMLLFEIGENKIGQKVMTEKDQESLFGQTFEKLGQHRRVNVLRVYGVISDELKESFDIIRTTRRRYLHLWSHDLGMASSDAVKVYNAGVSLVRRAIGQDVKEGRIMLNPALVRYLQRSGIYQPDDAPTGP